MGLFSRRKTILFSTSQPLFESTPNVVRDSILHSVTNNRSIVDDLVASTLDSLYLKSKGVRIYAENHYTYGLPNGTLTPQRASNDVVRTVIKHEIGHSVQVQSVSVDKPDAIFFGSPFLRSVRGYNPVTGILSNPPSFTQTPTSPVILFSAEFETSTRIKFTYRYSTNSDPERYAYETTNIDNPVDFNSMYYHAVYYKTGDRGELVGNEEYWFYREQDNQYETLSLNTEDLPKSEYFPIVPIREHKVNLTAPDKRHTDLYKTSRRVLNGWGIKIDDLGESVHSSPDINDVDHAYVMVGVSISDTDEPVLKYLHSYFGSLIAVSKYTLLDYLYWEGGSRTSPPPINTITIQDANYKMDLNFNYITSEIKTGNIGKVGSVTRSMSGTDRVTSENGRYSYEISKLTLTRQITSNFIEVIEVYGLYHVNYIYPTVTIDTSLKDALNTDDEQNNFIVPVSANILESMTLKDSQAVMYYAIRIVFNARIRKKLKWYETSFFRGLISVVAIALAVFGAYQFTVALLTAASAGVVALGSVIVQAALISIAANYAMDFLVNWLGLEAAMIIALIGSAVAMYNPSSISNIGNYKLPTSIDMLQITQALVNSGQGLFRESIEDIQKELEDFLAESSSLLEELEETKRDKDLNPYLFGLLTTQKPYETAEEFLTRVTYNDNVGILSLEAIDSFVDRMLKLDIPENEIRTEM